MRRRDLLTVTAGGVAAALVGGARPVRADIPPDYGPPVVDPPAPRILPGGLAVELVDLATAPRSRSSPPYANLNYLAHAGDGRPYLYANDTRGRVLRIHKDTGVVTTFLDLAKVRGAALLAANRQTGLRSFAFHPNFARGGQSGFRKVYTVSTESVASRPAGVTVLGGSAFTAVGDSVLAEWTVDGSSPPKVYVSSRREVLRIPVWSVEHNADQAMFNPAAVPGTAEYGKLYLTVGDGGNNPAYGDPYDQAQDLGSPLGKVLRLNPLKSGTAAFRYPPDNPHAAVGGVARLVWARGLRHPQNLCFDPVAGTGIVADIGQWQLEEVNLLVRGANYGWPHREGTFAFVRDQPEQLYGLPLDDATRGYTYPVAQFGRPEGLPRAGTGAEAFWTAICGGFVYRGSAVPALYGHYLCGELCTGRIFHVPLASLVQGQQATLQELTLLRGGVPVTLRGLAAAPSGRADLRFGQGADGEVYLLTKQDGKIRRMLAPPAA